VITLRITKNSYLFSLSEILIVSLVFIFIKYFFYLILVKKYTFPIDFLSVFAIIKIYKNRKSP